MQARAHHVQRTPGPHAGPDRTLLRGPAHTATRMVEVAQDHIDLLDRIAVTVRRVARRRWKLPSVGYPHVWQSPW